MVESVVYSLLDDLLNDSGSNIGKSLYCPNPLSTISATMNVGQVAELTSNQELLALYASLLYRTNETNIEFIIFSPDTKDTRHPVSYYTYIFCMFCMRHSSFVFVKCDRWCVWAQDTMFSCTLTTPLTTPHGKAVWMLGDNEVLPVHSTTHPNKW